MMTPEERKKNEDQLFDDLFLYGMCLVDDKYNRIDPMSDKANKIIGKLERKKRRLG